MLTAKKQKKHSGDKMNLFDAMESNSEFSTARTANGAVTLPTSCSKIIDLFFLLGAMRSSDEASIVKVFSEAFWEDQTIAMRCLFYARDVRGGQGERNFFKTCMKWLANSKHSDVAEKNLHFIPTYGRWNDLEVFVGTPLESKALSLWAKAIADGNSLACKWAPREASSKSALAKKIIPLTGLSPKAYRKQLASLSNVVESKMCANDWEGVNYSHVPSVAMKNYKDAFKKHSPNKWEAYLSGLSTGTATVNSSVLFPADIVNSEARGADSALLNAQWASLPNYMEGVVGNNLVVADTSGSMQGSGKEISPMDVSISLAMYISERAVGYYKNKFITFSERPSIQHLNGSDFVSRVRQLRNSDWGMSTNLIKVFNLILDSAKKNSVPASEMPVNILIISDMEFDSACSNDTNYEVIKALYAKSGYSLPKVIFWNVKGRPNNVPASKHENVNLVSGYSPSICKAVLSGNTPNPMDVVLAVVNSDRYSAISA
jgi:hypothetical protein